MANRLVLSLLLLVLGGCFLGSKAPQLAALLKVAPALIQRAPASGPIPEDQWPPELKTFNPKRVYADSEGIYIVTSTFFVEEEGLFLSRSPTFKPSAGGDPT